MQKWLVGFFSVYHRSKSRDDRAMKVCKILQVAEKDVDFLIDLNFRSFMTHRDNNQLHIKATKTSWPGIEDNSVPNI